MIASHVILLQVLGSLKAFTVTVKCPEMINDFTGNINARNHIPGCYVYSFAGSVMFLAV